MSTKQQQTVLLVAEVSEFAKREGLTVVRIFEECRTAKEPGRPQFNLMPT